MGEPFASFAQNFRVLYQSLLALSSSALVAISLILVNSQSQLGLTTLCAYKVCIISFALTIAIAVLASYIGLFYENNEGKSTKDKEPREINDIKFIIIGCSLVPFSFGFVAFIIRPVSQLG